MNVRVIREDENGKTRLLSIFKIDDMNKFSKYLDTAIKRCWSINVNTQDMADSEGEEYYPQSYEFVVPKLGGDILPYIQVHVE